MKGTFHVGSRVIVKNRTLRGKEFTEGIATIRHIHQGDADGVHADVEFVDEPGTTYPRWVFVKDQD